MNRIALVLALLLAPTIASAWSLKDMNEHVDRTNFIVGNHCSATLISSEERMLLTNSHCINKYLSNYTRQRVEDGVVSEVRQENKKIVPITQRIFDEFTEIGTVTYFADIVKYDRELDLAIVQLKDTTFESDTVAEIYNGPPLMRGEVVFAVGNTYVQFYASISKGIISSTNRTLPVTSVGNEYFQIDAGIEGGNSGGALYNTDGVLIGVPSAGIPNTHLGFVIPYNLIQGFLTDAGYEHIWNKR